jgi:hypothetical protein
MAATTPSSLLAALLLPLLTACTSAPASPGPDTPPFDGDVATPVGSALTCNASGRLALDSLASELATDYVELRQGWGSGLSAEITALSTAGAACSGASDRAACIKAVAAIEPAPGFDILAEPLLFQNVVLTTKGDRVQVARNRRELATLFGGAFDTKTKVALLLSLSNISLRCDDTKLGAVWPEGDGFRAIAVQATCDKDTRVLIRIAKDGTFTFERTEVIRRSPEGTTC